MFGLRIRAYSVSGFDTHHLCIQTNSFKEFYRSKINFRQLQMIAFQSRGFYLSTPFSINLVFSNILPPYSKTTSPNNLKLLEHMTQIWMHEMKYCKWRIQIIVGFLYQLSTQIKYILMISITQAYKKIWHKLLLFFIYSVIKKIIWTLQVFLHIRSNINLYY